MQFRSLLIQLQQRLLKWQPMIKNLFVVGEVAIVILWLLGVVAFIQYPYSSGEHLQLHLLIYDFGRRMGYVALILYLLTLIPGILTRLRWQPIIAAILNPYRRHLGISMFLCVFVHLGFTTSFPVIFGGVAPVVSTPQIFGFLAFFLLLPLWLTSNDPSQRFLGPGWKLLHRLTYLILFFVFLHVAFFRKRWAIPAFGILGLEVISWIVVWWRARTTAAVKPAVDDSAMVK